MIHVEPSTLIAKWRTQSSDYLRIAKAYNCRSNRDVREGYLKAALTLASCADELEAVMGQVGEGTAEAPGSSEPGTQAPDIRP